jgi:hypothetical protein
MANAAVPKGIPVSQIHALLFLIGEAIVVEVQTTTLPALQDRQANSLLPAGRQEVDVPEVRP